MDFSNYKFRASSAGYLMVRPRNKKETLSESTKIYLRDIFIQETYGRHKQISSRAMEKGNYVEEDSLSLMSNYFGKLLLKNKKSYLNEFFKGTPDIVLSDKIADAKSSWDIFTFFNANGSNQKYFYQMQVYMDLTGLEIAYLFYCLNNAPEHLIVQEKTKQMYKLGLVGAEETEAYAAMEIQIDKNMTFDDIPKKERLKSFVYNYDKNVVDELKAKVVEARSYLNNLSL